MNVYEFIEDAYSKGVKNIWFTDEGLRMKVNGSGSFPEDIKEKAAALFSELRSFACLECGKVDPNLAYDKDMQPFCSQHHELIGLVVCSVCNKRTRLTSRSTCPQCDYVEQTVTL
jgi:hypothetical protein